MLVTLLRLGLRARGCGADGTTPPDTKPGRYQPPDQLLAFLEAL